MKITDPWYFFRLLCVGGKAKCREHGAESKTKDFFTHGQLLLGNESIGVLE
jgi:hypothetical protein